jgi:hypothetical protein
MRQASPALLPSQLAVRQKIVPTQTCSLFGQSGLKGLQATSSRHLPEQIVPASFGLPKLTAQEKAGQTPEDKQHLPKQLKTESQGTLGSPSRISVPTDEGHLARIFHKRAQTSYKPLIEWYV